jgi:hypothetical protein
MREQAGQEPGPAAELDQIRARVGRQDPWMICSRIACIMAHACASV